MDDLMDAINPDTTTDELTEDDRKRIAALDYGMRRAFYAGMVWGRDFAEDDDDHNDLETAYQGFLLSVIISGA